MEGPPEEERAEEARAAARGVAARCAALVRALGLPLPPRPAGLCGAAAPALDRAPAAAGGPAAPVAAAQDGAPHPGGAAFSAARNRCAEEAQHSPTGAAPAGAAPPLPCARPAAAGLHRDTGAAGEAGSTDNDDTGAAREAGAVGETAGGGGETAERGPPLPLPAASLSPNKRKRESAAAASAAAATGATPPASLAAVAGGGPRRSGREGRRDPPLPPPAPDAAPDGPLLHASNSRRAEPDGEGAESSTKCALPHLLSEHSAAELQLPQPGQHSLHHWQRSPRPSFTPPPCSPRPPRDACGHAVILLTLP